MSNLLWSNILHFSAKNQYSEKIKKLAVRVDLGADDQKLFFS